MLLRRLRPVPSTGRRSRGSIARLATVGVAGALSFGVAATGAEENTNLPPAPIVQDDAAATVDSPDAVLLRLQFEDNKLYEHAMTFRLDPRESPAAAELPAPEADEVPRTTNAAGDATDDDRQTDDEARPPRPPALPPSLRYQVTSRLLTVAVSSDGTAVLAWSPQRVNARLELGLAGLPPLTYDSSRTSSTLDVQRPLLRELERQTAQAWDDLKGLSLRLEWQPDGRTVRSEPEEEEESLLEDPQRSASLEELRAVAFTTLGTPLPGRATQPGQTWSDPVAGRSYRLVGRDADGRYRIAVEGESLSGTLWFDADERQLVEGRFIQTLPDGATARSDWTLTPTDGLGLSF